MFMENKIEKKLKKWNLNGDIVRDNKYFIIFKKFIDSKMERIIDKLIRRESEFCKNYKKKFLIVN